MCIAPTPTKSVNPCPSNEAIAEGAIMTLSMHMPNFAYAELVNPKAAKTYARYRYPVDSYTYDDATSPKFTAGFMTSFENTVKLTDTFAKRHGKLFAVTETGINSLQNKTVEQIDPKWYQTVMDIITQPEYDCAYYMVWSNYSDEGFYTPYAVSKVKEVLNGHWLMDPFIRFYNNQKSIFAGDQRVARRVPPIQTAISSWGLTGYLTAPTGGSRVLAATMVTARLSQENVEAVLAVANETEEIRLQTSADGKTVSVRLKGGGLVGLQRPPALNGAGREEAENRRADQRRRRRRRIRD